MDLRLMKNHRPTASAVRQTAARGRFCRLEARDARHLRTHLLRLHPDDLRSRFMATAPRQMVDRYVRTIDWRRAVLIGCFIGRSLRGVCELHPIAGNRAEIAVSIERRFQGRGIGTAILSRTLLLARNRGLTALELRCLVDNQRMRRLVGKFDGETAVEEMEACATIHSLPATPATHVTEMVEQAGIFGATLIRFWLGRAQPCWPGADWPGAEWTDNGGATPDLFPRQRRQLVEPRLAGAAVGLDQLDPEPGDRDGPLQALALGLGRVGGIREVVLGVAEQRPRLVERELVQGVGRLGQDDEPVRIDLGKAALDEDAPAHGVAVVDLDQARAKQRQQRRVVGEDAEIALLARHHNHVGRHAGQHPLG